MHPVISICLLISTAAVILALALCAPSLLSDKNVFLESFVGSGLLGILGVLVTITVASAAQLHLTLNSIEERVNKFGVFFDTRSSMRRSVYCLFGLFVAALILVVIKPVLATTPASQTLANGSALLILIMNILILIDLTSAVFGLKPIKQNNNDVKG